MSLPFVFMDLRTADPEASRRFYAELFGWRADGPMFVDDGGPWGGLTELAAGDERRPMWVPYVPVSDLDEAVRRATGLGATVVRPRVDLPVGSVAVIEDPTRATLALWQAA